MPKIGNKKRKVQSDEESTTLVDEELEAEIAALNAIKAERTSNTVYNEDAILSNEDSGYNKEGLLKCIDDMDCTHLPFIQTLQVCEFNITIENENDDIEREVIS